MAAQSQFKHVDNTPLGYDNDQYKVAKSVSDISVNFYSFGLALGLKPSALDKIRSENPDTSAALQEVIKKWLSRVSLTSDAQSIEPSWRILVIAVDAETGGGNPALAKTIADAHPVVKKPSKKKQGEVSTSGTSTAKSVGKETPSAATGGRSMKGTTSSSAPSKEKSTADKKSATKLVTDSGPRSKSGGSSTAPQKAKQSTTMDGSSTEPQTIAKDLLVNPPLPEAICKKCDKVAREPMHPSCCEKKSESITCRPCSEKSKCPHHKKNPEKWILDQALKTKISKWTMRCPNKCSTKFTVNKYGEHQKQCPNAQKLSSSSSGKKKRPSEASKTESTSKKPKIG